MRTLAPTMICEDNLSIAWGRALLHVLAEPHDAAPLAVSISLATGEPEEVQSIRQAVDAALLREKKVSVPENAAMIFPSRTWKRCERLGRDAFYSEYLEQVLPRIKARMGASFHGTYFERMIRYIGFAKDKRREVNQLKHIIELWEKAKAKNRRPRSSALQVACFDPARDHNFAPVWGFPCLQQVSFAYDKAGGDVAVSAYYPCQYIFDRGYGNYLGLCDLGRFMAEAIGTRCMRVNCHVAAPLLGDVTKAAMRDVRRCVEDCMHELTGANVAGKP